MKFIVTLISVLVLGCQFSYAQHENDNWYFGKSAAIGFSNGIAKVLSDNPNTDYSTASASISDPKTGELLFYTNGQNIRNGKHEIVRDSIIAHKSIQEVIALPHPSITSSYYLFLLSRSGAIPSQPILAYLTIEVLPDGEIQVEKKTHLLTSGPFMGLCAVKNCDSDGYWLTTYQTGNKSFYTYEIRDTVNEFPVVSLSLTNYLTIGTLISNNTGEYLAMGNYSSDSKLDQVALFDINKKCGTISRNKSLSFFNGEYCFGLSFSENNEYLYASFSVGESFLVQFHLATGSYVEIYKSSSNLNQMRMGPDGRIYVSTHDNGVPGPRIDVINFPNLPGKSCDYKSSKLILGFVSNSTFHLPNFLQDTSTSTCTPDRYEFSILESCVGRPIEIKMTKESNSLNYWWVIDSTAFFTLEPIIEPKPAGEYIFHFFQEICNSIDSTLYLVKVGQKSQIDLGKDTTLCKGDSIIVFAVTDDSVSYFWPHNKSTDSFAYVSDTGYYSIEINNNGCITKDSIKIGWHPGLWSALVEEYYICEKDNELITLEAKKGLTRYLWHPTGDTTQWIVATKADSYFVVLSDFRGCTGTDKTVIKERCDGELYFPNAFSPNGDGINDFFKIDGSFVTEYNLKIFNRWGEQIFESDDLNKSWDGTFRIQDCPIESYIWLCSYRTIYKKKFNKIRYRSGRVNLVR